MSKLAKIMSLLGLAAFLAVSFVPPTPWPSAVAAAATGAVPLPRAASPRQAGTAPLDRETEVGAPDVRREVREWREDRWKRRLGVSLGVAVFRALTCAPTHVIIGNVYYYSCGVNWYRRTYVGSSVTYVVIAPPPGY